MEGLKVAKRNNVGQTEIAKLASTGGAYCTDSSLSLFDCEK